MRPLTEREMQVARLIVDVFKNDEIADRLLISSRTVKAYSDNIRRKINVEKRRHIPSRMRELGLL